MERIKSLFKRYNEYKGKRYILLEYENNIEKYKECYSYGYSISFELGSYNFNLRDRLWEMINSLIGDNDLFLPGMLSLSITNVGGDNGWNNGIWLSDNKIITIRYIVDLSIDEYKDSEYLEYLRQSLSIFVNVYIKPNFIGEKVEQQ